MREKRATESNGQPRVTLGQPRRNVSPAMRGGGKGSSQGGRYWGGWGNWSVIRSTKWKATQPEVGRRDRFMDSDGFDDAGYALEVRQSRFDSSILHRSEKGLAARTSSMGISGKHVFSTDARLNVRGLEYDSDGSNQHDRDNNAIGRKVSYYFTNFPECIPIFHLRHQFEVCGILTDVFIARRRNARGQMYGFVRFSHVRNSDKLSQALNNIWFGHLRIWAREARFDRFAANDNKPLVVSKSSKGKVEGVGRKKEVVTVTGEGGEFVRKGEGLKTQGKGRRGEGEKSVSVGEIEVQVRDERGGRKEERLLGKVVLSPVLQPAEGRRKEERGQKVVVYNIDEEGTELDGESNQLTVTNMAAREEITVSRGLLEYKSVQGDKEWAGSGIVATVGADESFLSIQNRVQDAGFSNVEVIPMGGDRVFMRCRNNDDIMKVFNEAVDFFSLLFSSMHHWLPTDTIYERGAWVRVYGTPIHAWNVNFFKLCTSECGRFLWADESTLDRGRMDYVRILLSTSSLVVLNKNMDLLVDGQKYSIKLVEEWGCNLGEDAFLTEEVSDQRVYTADDVSEHDVGYGFDEVAGDVDTLIADIHKEWQENEAKAAVGTSNGVEGPALGNRPAKCMDVPNNTSAGGNNLFTSSGGNNLFKVPLSTSNKESKNKHGSDFSAQKGGSHKVYSKLVSKKLKKLSGGFRYSSRNLKRIARMPDKDRKEILKILKKQAKARQARIFTRSTKSKNTETTVNSKVSPSISFSSVNKDWEHWVSVQGGSKAAAADVSSIGGLIGVKFNGDNNNRFNVLSKEGRRCLREEVGRILAKGVSKESRSGC